MVVEAEAVGSRRSFGCKTWKARHSRARPDASEDPATTRGHAWARHHVRPQLPLKSSGSSTVRRPAVSGRGLAPSLLKGAWTSHRVRVQSAPEKSIPSFLARRAVASKRRHTSADLRPQHLLRRCLTPLMRRFTRRTSGTTTSENVFVHASLLETLASCLVLALSSIASIVFANRPVHFVE